MLKFTEVTYGTVRKESGTPYWLVKESFRWWIKYETKKEKVVVMKGFRTNFGSVPKLIWWLIDPTEWNSFVLHDFLYTSKNFCNILEATVSPLTRKECDTILLDALLVEGCPIWKAVLIYWGVRIGGGIAWRG